MILKGKHESWSLWVYYTSTGEMVILPSKMVPVNNDIYIISLSYEYH